MIRTASGIAWKKVERFLAARCCQFTRTSKRNVSLGRSVPLGWSEIRVDKIKRWAARTLHRTKERAKKTEKRRQDSREVHDTGFRVQTRWWLHSKGKHCAVRGMHRDRVNTEGSFVEDKHQYAPRSCVRKGWCAESGWPG